MPLKLRALIDVDFYRFFNGMIFYQFFWSNQSICTKRIFSKNVFENCVKNQILSKN